MAAGLEDYSIYLLGPELGDTSPEQLALVQQHEAIADVLKGLGATVLDHVAWPSSDQLAAATDAEQLELAAQTETELKQALLKADVVALNVPPTTQNLRDFVLWFRIQQTVELASMLEPERAALGKQPLGYLTLLGERAAQTAEHIAAKLAGRRAVLRYHEPGDLRLILLGQIMTPREYLN